MLGFLDHPLPLPQTPESTPYEGWKNMDTHDLHLYMSNDRKTYQAIEKARWSNGWQKLSIENPKEARIILSETIRKHAGQFANLVNLRKVSFKEIAEEWMEF